jgi:polysaccharide export outer membrane protein
MFKKIIALFVLSVLFGSCASNSKIVYMNNAEQGQSGTLVKYENVLQPDDKLAIIVTADEPALAAPFNLIYVSLQSNQLNNVNNNDALTSYLIDQKGEIDFPGVGKVKLAGLTRIEAEKKIKDILSKQIQNPGVNLRVINFKVSVSGEVVRPGPVVVNGDRITILEALSAVGDLTIYGKRKEIMIIREKEGVKTIGYVDITDKDIINSPYYYLCQNDVIYVKPNKTKVNSSVIGPNLTVGISAISLIVTIIALSTR